MTPLARVLVVAPAFHGYGRSIRRAFERLGFASTVYVYDELRGVRAKVHNKARYELPHRLGLGDPHLARMECVTRRAIAAVRQHRPDVVVVVKGDLLGGEFVDEVRAQRARSVLWLYDDIARMRSDLGVVRRYDLLATYSAVDRSQLRLLGIDALLVRVGFDDEIVPTIEPPDDRLVFVGARYPERTEVLAALMERGIDVHAYGRDWSHALQDRLRTWDLRRPHIPASGDLSLPCAVQIMGRALATLNVHARGQGGLNTRVFEACGAGALQVVDRQDVAEVYDIGTELLVASKPGEVADAMERARSDARWAGDLRTVA